MVKMVKLLVFMTGIPLSTMKCSFREGTTIIIQLSSLFEPQKCEQYLNLSGSVAGGLSRMQCDEGLLRQEPQDVAASTSSSATGKQRILNKQICESFRQDLFSSFIIISLEGETTIINYILTLVYLGCKLCNALYH